MTAKGGGRKDLLHKLLKWRQIREGFSKMDIPRVSMNSQINLADENSVAQ